MEDDIGDPDDYEPRDVNQHTGVQFTGHSAKDLGITDINFVSALLCVICFFVTLCYIMQF